jgi:hypothetical protein
VSVALVAASVHSAWAAPMGRLLELPGARGLLYTFWLVAGSGTAVSVLLGYRAMRQRDLPQQRPWIVRVFAIGLGAGTHLLTLGLGGAIGGDSDRSIALLQTFGWAINLALAAWIIDRRPIPRSALSGVPTP